MYPGAVIKDSRPEADENTMVEWRRLLFRAVVHVIQNPRHIKYKEGYIHDFCMPMFHQVSHQTT